jgi:hypothetical protein
MVALNWTRRVPAHLMLRGMMAEALFLKPTVPMPTELETSSHAFVIPEPVHG